MSAKRPTKPLDTLIEPNDFCVGVIRDILAELKETFGTRRKVEADIKKYAADVNMDIFTLLQTSPSPTIRSMGMQQLNAAVELAGKIECRTRALLLTSLNENPNLTGVTRQRVSAGFMVTKKEVSGMNNLFSESSDAEKASLYLTKIIKYNDELINAQALAIEKEIPIEQALGSREKIEKEDPLLMAAREEGGSLCDVLSHPRLIGLLYTAMAVNAILIRKLAELSGKDFGPGGVDSVVEQYVAEQKARVAAPYMPKNERTPFTAANILYDWAPSGRPN